MVVKMISINQETPNYKIKYLKYKIKVLNDKIQSLRDYIGRDISDSSLDKITFIRAIRNNNLVKVQNMLDNDISVNAVGWDRDHVYIASALYIACEFGFVDIIKLLISNGADPKHYSNYGNIGSPLMAAVQYDNVDAARYLLSIGLNVNTPSDTGYTPLQIVKSLEMVNLILSTKDLDLDLDLQLESAIRDAKESHSDKPDMIERLESMRKQ